MKPVDPVQTKWIPGLMWQDGPNCYSFSLKHIMQFKLSLLGVDADLDAPRFDKEAVAWNKGRPIALYTTFLQFAKAVGMWDKKTKKYIKIKNYKAVRVPAHDYVAEHGPVLLGIDLETGEKISQRLDKRGVLTKRTSGFHSVVALETSGDAGQFLLIADSNKPNSPKGYWWLPRVLSKMILQIYEVTM